MDKVNSNKVYALIEHYKERGEPDWEMLLCIFKEVPSKDSLFKFLIGLGDCYYGHNRMPIDLDKVVSNLNVVTMGEGKYDNHIGLEIREMDLL